MEEVFILICIDPSLPWNARYSEQIPMQNWEYSGHRRQSQHSSDLYCGLLIFAYRIFKKTEWTSCGRNRSFKSWHRCTNAGWGGTSLDLHALQQKACIPHQPSCSSCVPQGAQSSMRCLCSGRWIAPQGDRARSAMRGDARREMSREKNHNLQRMVRAPGPQRPSLTVSNAGSSECQEQALGKMNTP